MKWWWENCSVRWTASDAYLSVLRWARTDASASTVLTLGQSRVQKLWAGSVLNASQMTLMGTLPLSVRNWPHSSIWKKFRISVNTPLLQFSSQFSQETIKLFVYQIKVSYTKMQRSSKLFLPEIHTYVTYMYLYAHTYVYTQVCCA